MVMVEGRGLMAPHSVKLVVGAAEQRYLHSIVRERAKRRSYANRIDQWGRGMTGAASVPCLGRVPKDELPGLTGLIGEYALFMYLVNEFGLKNVDWSPGPAQFGDGGKDIDIFNQTIQVKTRRRGYGKILVRRISRAGGQIEPLNFDILVGCEWQLADQVSLIGWCKRGSLFNSNFASSRFDHYNLEIRDSLLLPMGRLLDHLLTRQSVAQWR